MSSKRGEPDLIDLTTKEVEVTASLIGVLVKRLSQNGAQPVEISAPELDLCEYYNVEVGLNELTGTTTLRYKVGVGGEAPPMFDGPYYADVIVVGVPGVKTVRVEYHISGHGGLDYPPGANVAAPHSEGFTSVPVRLTSIRTNDAFTRVVYAPVSMSHEEIMREFVAMGLYSL